MPHDDLHARPPVAAALPIARCTVHVGATCTAYRRAGAGAPVILLGGGDALVQALATRFRVVAPDVPEPEPGTAFAHWLRGFMDGVGLPQASLVARDAHAMRVLGFRLTDPLRVDRLVLCYRDAPDPSVCAAAAPERLGDTALLLRREPLEGAADATADVIRFLAGDDAPA